MTAFAVAYFIVDGNCAIHDWPGYIALGLVAFRLIWGVIGSRHTRFSDFLSGC